MGNTRLDKFYSSQLERIKNQYPLLSQQEAGELAEKARKGDIEARNTLVLSNLCLIHMVARECNIPNAEIEDMIQDGYVELIEKAQGFNPDKGASFSTYIWLWIKQKIFRSNIPMAERSYNLLLRVNKIKETFYQLNERYPSEEEIADALGMTREVLRSKLSKIETRTSVSLDSLVSNDADNKCNYYDIKLSENSITPEEEIVNNEICNIVRSAVEKLPQAEGQVIKYRNNMGNVMDKDLSYREIGSIMNVSQETIRNYEKKAKDKLKKLLEERGIQAA